MNIFSQTRTEWFAPTAAFSEPMMQHQEAPEPICEAYGFLEHLSMSRARSVVGESADNLWRWTGCLPADVYPDSEWTVTVKQVLGRDRAFRVLSAVKQTAWTVELTEVG